MGTTIDDSIKYFTSMSRCYSKDYEPLSIAVDTMRKYQKIEQIINNAKDSDGAVKYNWLYEQIRKVLEDGRDYM